MTPPTIRSFPKRCSSTTAFRIPTRTTEERANAMARLTSTNAIVLPEQSLPTGRMVGLGLQHVIAMFGATVLAPFLMGFDPNLAIFFSGIGTLIFMLVVRGRVPSYLGSSFAFIGPVIAAKKLRRRAGRAGRDCRGGGRLFRRGLAGEDQAGHPGHRGAHAAARNRRGHRRHRHRPGARGLGHVLQGMAAGALHAGRRHVRGRSGPRLRQADPRPDRGRRQATSSPR